MNSNSLLQEIAHQNYTPLKESRIAHNRKIGFPAPLLYIVSALIFTLSISFTYLKLSSQSFTTNSKASENTDLEKVGNILLSKERAIFWKKKLMFAPQNPTSVTAVAVKQKTEVEVKSDESNTYSKLTFTWSGDKAKEPGTKIVGYYVYFGPENTEIPFPDKDYNKSVDPQFYGTYVESSSYTTSELTKGIRYHLYIKAVSDSKDEFLRFGLERIDEFKSLPAKKLFTYTYQ